MPPDLALLYEHPTWFEPLFAPSTGAASVMRPNFLGTPEQLRERIEEYEEAGLDLLLLQMSPQAEEMDRFAAQVIAPMRAS